MFFKSLIMFSILANMAFTMTLQDILEPEASTITLEELFDQIDHARKTSNYSLLQDFLPSEYALEVQIFVAAVLDCDLEENEYLGRFVEGSKIIVSLETFYEALSFCNDYEERFKDRTIKNKLGNFILKHKERLGLNLSEDIISLQNFIDQPLNENNEDINEEQTCLNCFFSPLKKLVGLCWDL